MSEELYKQMAQSIIEGEKETGSKRSKHEGIKKQQRTLKLST